MRVAYLHVLGEHRDRLADVYPVRACQPSAEVTLEVMLFTQRVGVSEVGGFRALYSSGCLAVLVSDWGARSKGAFPKKPDL